MALLDDRTTSDPPGLATVRSLLAPGPGGRAEYLALGPAGRPTFLLPRDRRVAVAACRSYNALRPPAVRRRRRAVSAAVGVGLGPVLADPVVVDGAPAGAADRPLLEELADLLGVGPLLAAVGMGGVDDWWTPVLQLFSADGRAVGYAKVGTTPLAATLVRNEARVLRHLRRQPPHRLVVPRVLAHGQWAGHEVVVTAPLPPQVRALDRTMPPRCPLPGRSAGAPLPLGASAWWAAVCEQLSHPATADVLAEVRDRVEAAELPLGLAHGDWVPWNLALLPGRDGPSLAAWDWEYGATDAPQGLDDVHGGYVVARQRGADVAGAMSVGLVHAREARHDLVPSAAVPSRTVRRTPGLLEVLGVVHPAAVLAREVQRARLVGGAAGPDGLTREGAAVLAVLERRLGRSVRAA